MRVDFGIVWSHGMQHIDEILNILNEYKDLELIWFSKYTPPDFGTFISQVYSLDTVPLEHLRAKNAYLNNVGHDVYLMLIRNNKPEPVMVGEGEFRHEQCMLINKFKWQVRERFNPVVNGERSEAHVIHCSDYPSQTENFMNILGLGHKYDWTLSKTAELPWVPYYIDKFTHFVIRKYRTDKLMVNIMSEDGGKRCMKLKDSPHFKYVRGIKDEYINYWNTYKGTRLTENHTPAKFDSLINWLTPEKYKEMNKLIIIDSNIIIDGVHRAAVLTYQGEEIITVLEIR